MDSCDLSKCEPLTKIVRQRCEPLRAGDIIKYWSRIYRCGDPLGHRTATVIEVDPQGRQHLFLSNMECLGNETQVKRVYIVSGSETLDVTLQSFDGSYRRIEEFDLVEGRVRLEDLPIEHPGTKRLSNGGINGMVQKKMEGITNHLVKMTAGDEQASTMEVLHESQSSAPGSFSGKEPLLHTNYDVRVAGKRNCVVHSMTISRFLCLFLVL